MKKAKLKEIPTAELMYKKKMAMAAIYLSMVALSLSFIVILWSFKDGELNMRDLTTSSMVLICSLFSINMVKNMREELSSRD